MFAAIVHWLNTVPLQDPARAFVIVGITLAFSAVMWGLWEIFFTGAARIRRTER